MYAAASPGFAVSRGRRLSDVRHKNNEIDAINGDKAIGLYIFYRIGNHNESNVRVCMWGSEVT